VAVYEALAKRGAGQRDLMPAFLRTHPLTAERSAALKETFNALQAAEPAAALYLGRENLRRRVVRSEREFAE
jgi:hypothetical protein